MRPLAVVLLLALTAPALAAEPVKTPAPASKRGFRVDDRRIAEAAIAFRPTRPDTAVEDVALQPPFYGGQVSANEGIAYTYERAGRTWILSEWPRNGGSLDAFAPFTGPAACAGSHAVGSPAKPRGIVWSTPRNIVLSLVADGHAPKNALAAEQRRLARRGACR